MTPADAGKAAGLLFAAAIVQVSLLAFVNVLGGTPDLVLVLLVSIALLRGSIVGAAGGFFAGLVVDTATLGTLGLSSLLYTVAGYWVGRYGETTGRDRSHAPFLSIASATVAVSIGALVLHYLLDDAVSARVVLLEALVPTIALNLLLTAPVHALVRRVLPPPEWDERAREVRLLG
jgi:rod shape-determining protein MreD